MKDRSLRVKTCCRSSISPGGGSGEDSIATATNTGAGSGRSDKGTFWAVEQTRDLLIYADQSSASLSDSKREEKMAELAKNIRELKSILYGNSESEPVSEACAQLTQEFFREDTLAFLIFCLSQLNLEARKDATQVVANLQRQQVNSRLIASDYLEKNTDLLDTLIAGYENTDMALHYGVMLRECIRHQTVARSKERNNMFEVVLYKGYVLVRMVMNVKICPDVKKFFDYIRLPYFDISADAAATFKVKHD
ncbi:hypothetical protein H0E87_027497 [Populus deltoides]|uniref:Mo25 family protein n=1 Tax=Populus deltoides TaxID=3696 RepID=A0A8T2X0Y6_POPDE|nr:hypothetical protein H0E87_027497 [Populus deltoides]